MIVMAKRAVRPGGESARKMRSFVGPFIGTPPAVAGVNEDAIGGSPFAIEEIYCGALPRVSPNEVENG
jgi:hypothetical protein